MSTKTEPYRKYVAHIFFFLTLFMQLLIYHQYIFKYTGIFGYHTQTHTPTLNTLYLLYKRKAGSYG